jgi:uncharacterized protein (DUF362 family)
MDVVVTEGEEPIGRTMDALKIYRPEMPKVGSILIKPNLVEPLEKTSGAVTRPEIVEGILRYIQEISDAEILIGEGAAIRETSLCFEKAGYLYFCEKYDVKLVDLNKGPFEKVNLEGGSMEAYMGM